jgi:SAM-dependent methyltransferase
MDSTSAPIAEAFTTFKKQFRLQPEGRKEQMKRFVLENFGDKSISVLDIGGGKFPLFSMEEVPPTWRYTVNDIAAEELSQLPQGYRTLHADICDDLPEQRAQYDLLFSSMLAEHIPDARRFYESQYAMLKKGGVGLHLHPTLYALPFVLNWLTPDALAKKIVETLKPHRRKRRSVFPAFYDWCTAGKQEITEGGLHSR